MTSNRTTTRGEYLGAFDRVREAQARGERPDPVDLQTLDAWVKENGPEHTHDGYAGADRKE